MFLAIDWQAVYASIQPMLHQLVNSIITQPIFTLLGTIVGTLVTGIFIQIYKALVGERWTGRIKMLIETAEKLGLLNQWTGEQKKAWVKAKFQETTKRGFWARVLKIFPPALVDAFIDAMVEELFPKAVSPAV
jgi:hypothetical protein